MERIYNAQYRKLPDGYKALSAEEITQVNTSAPASNNMPVQEKGVRPACPLPYELYANGALDIANSTFNITMQAGNVLFGVQSAGCPFKIYAPGKYLGEEVRVWNYAVAAGDTLTGTWPVGNFNETGYHLCLYGPNGFFREFAGSPGYQPIAVKCTYALDKTGQATGNIKLHIENLDKHNSHTVIITDNAYKTDKQIVALAAAANATVLLDLQASHHWYDFTVSTGPAGSFSQRFAGHVETGQVSNSDPYMGGVM